MPWYKSGTVSVALNSNAVIGTGTAFIANGRVGDAFRGPDGGWYEITNIASDTAMSISPNYQGVTNAGGVYALAPMQGYVKDSADALRALVNQFGGVLAVLGTDPTLAGVRDALNLTTTDGLSEGTTNLYFTAARAIASALTGFVTTTNSPVVATDSIVVAAGKLQAQVASALPKAGGTLTGPINDAPAQTIASAATVDIGASTSNVVAISGTTTITGFGTIEAGARRTVRFLGSLLLTHNATSLILPGQATIATAANDVAVMLSLGGGNWMCVDYERANGKPVAFAFDRSSVVGTVSQTSGLPTGAIVERGSNTNGNFVKYADGTMICWYYTSVSYALSTPYGSQFISASLSYPFPVGFVGVPMVVPSAITTPQVVWAAIEGSASASAMTMRLIGVINGATSYAGYIAIGRWF
ncbi:phage tail protein [Pseudomonas azerbaijanoccidentalis]|uniref:phage tail protein n=1 Tax=Pseudomonas azerbaijanoccidentalis TaxID=2842347 RepID=UPI001CED3D8F|nr:phage tail protein [Pseudomonas azerbaijanoccidentalis]